MFEVDGSQKSGSGTILRLSVALAAIRGEQLHINNIRRNRSRPGLQPQHLEAVLTAAKLCNAELKGAHRDSTELWFKPQTIPGGSYEAQIGTAGSIPMLIMTILPICAAAEKPVRLHVTKGGTDVPQAPSINYLRFVLFPQLERMGLKASLTVHVYGYYPKGMGEVTVTTEPCKTLKPVVQERFGSLRSIKGVSICTFLADRQVADRQAQTATAVLGEKGFLADVQVINDTSNRIQKGSSITLWAETNSNVLLGSDSIGELGKPSEIVGREAADRLWTEISTNSTVDVHASDMLIPYIAIAPGRSIFFARELSEHLQTNLWLTEKLLDVHFVAKKKQELYQVEKEA